MGRRFRIALAVVVVPAFLATGCGGDDSEESLPPVDTSSSSKASPDEPTAGGKGSGGTQPSDDPTYAPKPKGAKLTKGEEAAYRAALKDARRWQKIEGDLKARPRTGTRMQNQITDWTYNPYSTQIYKLIREFKQKKVRQAGNTEVHWRVPVAVDLEAKFPRLTWRECWGLGSLKIYNRGELVRQKDQRPHETKVTMVADDSGRWHIKKAKDVGRCAA